MHLPEYIKNVINTYEENGYLCYVVGGAVRDSLLGIKPSDFDLATNALPHISMKMFDKTIDTGLKHGTITIMIEGNSIEVTTFRIDGEYKDNRRPESVTFTVDVREDLARRDFTVNSIAYSEKEGYVDFFSGISDLDRGIIRAVGNPHERFIEDGLRMLRAIRFSAKLGFSIEDETLRAISDLCPLIKNISGERIKDELDKLLLSKNRSYISYLYNTELINHMNVPYLCYEKKQIDKVCENLFKYKGDSLSVCYTLWFMYAEYGNLKNIMKTLKFDNKMLNEVLILHKEMYTAYEPDPYFIRKALYRTSHNLLYNILDIKAIIDDSFNIDAYKMVLNEIINNGDPITLRELALTGEDLKALGLQGVEIGKCLSSLLDEVHKNPCLNERERLIKIAMDRL